MSNLKPVSNLTRRFLMQSNNTWCRLRARSKIYLSKLKFRIKVH